MTNRPDRAISTVVDVTFALLLVSASIGVLAVALTDDEPAHDPMQADRTAETLASTTRTVEYTLHPVDGESHFAGSGYDYERSTHGTLTGLLADAAVTNAEFPDGGDADQYAPDDDTYLTKAGRDFGRAVDGAVREALTSAGGDAHVVAVWTPYTDSAIRGRMVAGADLPAGVDTSTATLVVPSKLPALDEAEVERAYRVDEHAGVAELVAAAVVEGYFPTGETQLALERDGLGRALAVYRYQRMAEVVDHPDFETDPALATTDPHPVSRTQADAAAANAELQADLAATIREELQREFPGADAERIASAVSVGEVRITVTTWNE